MWEIGEIAKNSFPQEKKKWHKQKRHQQNRVFQQYRSKKATHNKKENLLVTCYKKLSRKFDVLLNTEWNYDAE